MFYRFVIGLCRIFFRLFFRPSFEGRENIPENGPFIICSNHVSLLDMFLFGPGVPQMIHFMAKEELFKIPLIGFAIKHLGAYPVKRGQGDMFAAKTTLKLLKENKVVCIFPEGTRRNKSKSKIRPKSGAILFALQTGAPILPVGVFGNYRLFSRLRVVFGKPYVLNSKKDGKQSKVDMQQMVDELMEKIYALEQNA